jgi:hypothetical protein
MPLNRIAYPSPNYSSRAGSPITTLVLHTAEGALSIASLGAYFSNPAAQVSSHVGIDDQAGTIGEYVQRPGKAWTAANANPYAVQAELCAFASWDSAEWNRHPNMLATAAAWIAEESAALGIPIATLTDAQAQSAGRGVCQHAQLGAMGGGHWDCGPSFPIARVLEMAKGGPTPPPPQPEEEPEMLMIYADGTGKCLFDGATKQAVADGESDRAFTAAGVKSAKVSRAQFDLIPWVSQILVPK